MNNCWCLQITEWQNIIQGKSNQHNVVGQHTTTAAAAATAAVVVADFSL